MDRDRHVEVARRSLALHAHDPRTERCPLCGRAYCPPYAEAAALLRDSGEQVDPAAVEVRSL